MSRNNLQSDSTSKNSVSKRQLRNVEIKSDYKENNGQIIDRFNHNTPVDKDGITLKEINRLDGVSSFRPITNYENEHSSTNDGLDHSQILDSSKEEDPCWALMGRYCSPQDNSSTWQGFQIPSEGDLNLHHNKSSTVYTPGWRNSTSDSAFISASSMSAVKWKTPQVDDIVFDSSDAPINISVFHSAQKSLAKSSCKSKSSFKSTLPNFSDSLDKDPSNEDGNISLNSDDVIDAPPNDTLPSTNAKFGTGASPFNTFRNNSANIALHETQWYLDKINDLEQKLRIAEEKSIKDAEVRNELEQRIKTLVTEVRFADQTCLEECLNAQNFKEQMEKLQLENSQIKTELKQLTIKEARVNIENESLKDQIVDLKSKSLSSPSSSIQDSISGRSKIIPNQVDDNVMKKNGNDSRKNDMDRVDNEIARDGSKEKLENDLKIWTKEIELLRQTLQGLGSTKSDIDELHLKKVSELESELHRTKIELTNAQKEFSIARAFSINKFSEAVKQTNETYANPQTLQPESSSTNEDLENKIKEVVASKMDTELLLQETKDKLRSCEGELERANRGISHLAEDFKSSIQRLEEVLFEDYSEPSTITKKNPNARKENHGKQEPIQNRSEIYSMGDSSALNSTQGRWRDFILEIRRMRDLLSVRQSEFDELYLRYDDEKQSSTAQIENLTIEMANANEKLQILQDEIIVAKESSGLGLIAVQSPLECQSHPAESDDRQKSSLETNRNDYLLTPDYIAELKNETMLARAAVKNLEHEKLKIANTMRVLLQTFADNFLDLESKVGEVVVQHNCRLTQLTKMVDFLRESVLFDSSSSQESQSHSFETRKNNDPHSTIPSKGIHSNETCSEVDNGSIKIVTSPLNDDSTERKGNNARDSVRSVPESVAFQCNSRGEIVLSSDDVSGNESAESQCESKNIFHDGISVLSESVEANNSVEKQKNSDFTEHLQWLVGSPLYESVHSYEGSKPNNTPLQNSVDPNPKQSHLQTVDTQDSEFTPGEICNPCSPNELSSEESHESTSNPSHKECNIPVRGVASSSSQNDLCAYSEQAVVRQINEDSLLKNISSKVSQSTKKYTNEVRLLQKIDTLQFELEETTQQLAQTRTTVLKSNESTGQLMSILEFLKDELLARSSLEDRVSALVADKQSLQAKLISNSEMLSTVTDENQVLQLQLSQLNASLRAVNCSDIDEVNFDSVNDEVPKDYDELFKETETLVSNLVTRSIEFERCNEQLEELMQEKVIIEHQREEIVVENVRLKDEVISVTNQKDSLVSELNEKELCIKHLSDELEACNIQLISMQKELAQSQSAKDAQLDAMKLSNENLQNKISRLRDYVRKLTAKCDSWQRFYIEVQAKFESARQRQRNQNLYYVECTKYLAAERESLHVNHMNLQQSQNQLEEELDEIAKELSTFSRPIIHEDTKRS